MQNWDCFFNALFSKIIKIRFRSAANRMVKYNFAICKSEIWLYCDLVERLNRARGKAIGLRTESMESEVYEIEKNYNLTLKLHLVLPEKPWIALLKVNGIEGDEPARSYKLYGMKVIGAGGV
jgi:hypothetical protein